MKIGDLANWWFRGRTVKDVLSRVTMPTLVVVSDLETAQELQRRYDQRRYLVVHSPEFIAKKNSPVTQFRLGLKKYSGIFIPSDQMSLSMAHAYLQSKKNGSNGDDIASLEAKVEQTACERAANMAALASTARNLIDEHEGSGRQQDDQQILALINQLTTAQFEYIEHLAREAVQNADGSSDDKKNNPIHVYVNRETRTFCIEDQGRGMTQEVMDKNFFDLYSSLNEALAHAAGKFGIGAISFFGADHDYVMVDSLPCQGEGGRTQVDSELYREETYQPTQRTTHGTTVEIRFAETSEIDFDRLVQVLEEDCGYIESPLYLHEDDKEVRQLNRPLTPPTTRDTLSFSTTTLQGHVQRTSVLQYTELDLLSHNIRLQSIPTRGYCGAVNCSGLDTTFSRDSVQEDPVLAKVLQFVDKKSRELGASCAMSKRQMSLEARLDDYHEFVSTHLFLPDGTVNEPWLVEQSGSFRRDHRPVQDSAGKGFALAYMSHVTSFLWGGMEWLSEKYDNLVSRTLDRFDLSGERRYQWRMRLESTAAITCIMGAMGGIVAPFFLHAGYKSAGYSSYELPEAIPAPIWYGSFVPGVYLAALIAEGFGRAAIYGAQNALETRFIDYCYRSEYDGFKKGKETKGFGIARGLAKGSLAVGTIGAAFALLIYGAAEIGNIIEDVRKGSALENQVKKGTASAPALPGTKKDEPQQQGNQGVSVRIPLEPTPVMPAHNYPLLLLAGLGTAYLVRNQLKRREQQRVMEKHRERVYDKQRGVVRRVAEALEQLPHDNDIEVYLGGRLKSGDRLFYLDEGRVVLNKERLPEVRPDLVAFAYATEILRDPALVTTIATNIGGP